GGGYWTVQAGVWTHIFPVGRPNSVDVFEAGYDPSLHGLFVSSVGPAPNDPYVLWWWPNGRAGFVNITAIVTHPGVSCDGNDVGGAFEPYSPNYDPTLGGLVCFGVNAAPLNPPPEMLWEFS
ncbi:MAG: hypothetical protein ACREDE_11550, partial [Thermoplasmata archaeon]